MAFSLIDLAITIIAALVPSLVYLVWIRNTETHDREPYLALEKVFLYGLTIALGIAFILETVVVGVLDSLTTSTGAPLLDQGEIQVLLALIVAPIIEELAKASGVFTAGRRLTTETENGFIYGAACGLGFAAGENVLYFTAAWLSGLEVFIAVAIVRTLTSTLLHTSATAITGFGISRSKCFATWVGTPRSWLPYLLVAIGLHSLFNFLALLGGEDTFLSLFTLLLSFLLVITTISIIRRKIAQLDREYRPGTIRCQ
jgi:protease PrsW